MRAPVYQFAPFQLDVGERLFSCNGRIISLRGKVFDTLCLLLERAGHLVHREELMQAIWPDATVGENNLEHNLSVLRRAFRLNCPERKFIETVYRKGYRFVGDVRKIDPRPELLRPLQDSAMNGSSPSSRLRLQGLSRGVRHSGDVCGQAVGTLGREDDELRRLARELQGSAASLLNTLTLNVDRMAEEKDGETIARLMADTAALGHELCCQLRAHLLPVLYLTKPEAVEDLLNDQRGAFGDVQQTGEDTSHAIAAAR